ncbi:MAG: chemotaxis response regulator protein-glutamate methylesterase [Spirochaetes bacterium]|nr:chemotaxis response regulator protein-glutamate methylesterase [Spirochaetota bacterium]
MSKKIKVHIVDDSATVRMVLGDILASDPSIEVIAASADPIIAEKKLEKEWPDVFILDVEMPNKDGITFLKEIMAKRPTPVVMCSHLTVKNAKTTLEALSAGAVEIIAKPKVGLKDFFTESALMLIDTVKSASQANVNKIDLPVITKSVQHKLSADAVLSPWDGHRIFRAADKLIAIGASAGGTQAIEAVLTALPEDVPGIIIVQHMPEKFTKAFADRLDKICRIRVKEAENGDSIVQGNAYIAPGNYHMLIERQGGRYKIVVKDGPLVSRHRPAVDVLFRSVAKTAGGNAIGIILTGMGDDGAAGMLEMKNAGSKTVAQSEETCVVFGMPKEAIKRGAADKVLPLNGMPNEIMQFSSRN